MLLTLAENNLAAAIRGLFAAGEQGIWLDPSDFSTLYQDAAGTTPVTALGQPVGLALDKSKGLTLGPDMVANGGFSSDTGWTRTFTGAGTCTISGGSLNITSSGTDAASASQTPATPLVPGAFYRVVFDVVVTSGSGYFFIGSTIGASILTFTTSGRKECILPAGSTVSYYGVSRTSGSANNFSVDNLSVQPLSGNHATQTTAGNRPTVEARVNLLTKTSSPTDWTFANSPIITHGVSDPFGGTAAVTFTDDDAVVSKTCTLPAVTLAGESISRQFSVYVKQQAGDVPALIRANHTGGTQVDARVCVNTTTGAVTATANCTASTARHVAPSGDIWWRVTMTVTSNANTQMSAVLYAGALLNSTSISSAHTGTNTYAFPQFALSSDPFRDVYQRVNTATDYSDIGALRYLQFDGATSNRWLQTASINFTGTDKMTVWTGLRKESDAAAGVVAELSATIGTNNGAFAILAPASAAANVQFASKGTTQSSATVSSGVAAPLTAVLTGIGNIAGPYVAARVNGAIAASNTFAQGTGNFGNYPLYIGRRGGTTLPFNGRLYQLIVRGAESNDSQIASAEYFVNTKTRAY